MKQTDCQSITMHGVAGMHHVSMHTSEVLAMAPLLAAFRYPSCLAFVASSLAALACTNISTSPVED